MTRVPRMITSQLGSCNEWTDKVSSIHKASNFSLIKILLAQNGGEFWVAEAHIGWKELSAKEVSLSLSLSLKNLPVYILLICLRNFHEGYVEISQNFPRKDDHLVGICDILWHRSPLALNATCYSPQTCTEEMPTWHNYGNGKTSDS